MESGKLDLGGDIDQKDERQDPMDGLVWETPEDLIMESGDTHVQ